MPEEEVANGENEFQKRTEMLEEMLRNAESNWKPIEYSLIFDELGRTQESEQEHLNDIYYEGIKMKADLSETQIEEIKVRLGLEVKSKKRRNLRAIAESYERENEGQNENPVRNRRRVTAYSIAQNELDKGVMGYIKIKRPDLRKYEQALEFLGNFGIHNLIGEGGATIPIKQCKPSRIIAVALGMYNTAQTRLQELENHEREITNGTQPDYE